MIDDSISRYPPATSRYAITQQAALLYLSATGDSTSADGHLPLLFSTVCLREALSNLVAMVCRENSFSRPVLHLAHEVCQASPLRPGMTVESTVHLRSVRPSALGSSLVIHGQGSDAAGHSLFSVRTRILLVGLRLPRWGDERWGGKAGPGPEMWTHEVTEHCPVDLIHNYADASGDHNPVHLSYEAARAAGYAAPIVHGLLVLVLAARTAVGLFAGDDPANLRAVCGRFISPVLAGDTVSIRYGSLGPSSPSRKVAFDVRSSSGTAVRRGALEIDAPL